MLKVSGPLKKESAPEEEESILTWKGKCGSNKYQVKRATEREQLLKMLADFKSVMSGKVGRTLSCQHHINLKETIPVQQQPYRLPHMYRNAVRKKSRR